MAVRGKHILLGVCGSIAAYKAAYLVRLLTKEGASVQVVMTPDATRFITPLTLSTLSGNPVLVSYADPETGVWNNHVHLSAAADAIVIAPASANTLAKLSNGMCDNLLGAIYLSATCPVFLAPAMDLDMWKHPATQANIDRLQEIGNLIVPPGDGALASGLHGEGRLAEPEDILAALKAYFQTSLPLRGKHALVTAGPTHEAIDPVRYIGNHSSGKMGYAIAAELVALGASVTLVSGPSNLPVPAGLTKYIPVRAAAEMLDQCIKYFPNAEITVMSAAVADYTPQTVAAQKLKKSTQQLSIALNKTTDILATLGSQKRPEQILVGFALETDNERANAEGKLKAKNLDFIILNSMQDAGAGFAGDNNKVTIIHNTGEVEPLELMPKTEVAREICTRIRSLLS